MSYFNPRNVKEKAINHPEKTHIHIRMPQPNPQDCKRKCEHTNPQEHTPHRSMSNIWVGKRTKKRSRQSSPSRIMDPTRVERRRTMTTHSHTPNRTQDTRSPANLPNDRRKLKKDDHPPSRRYCDILHQSNQGRTRHYNPKTQVKNS